MPRHRSGTWTSSQEPQSQPYPKNGLIQREEAIRARRLAELAKVNRNQLNSFREVRALFDDFVKEKKIPIAIAPHIAFWDRMAYDQFINGNILDYTESPPIPIVDPRTGDPLRVLIPGNSAESNLILSLKGEGPLFDQETGLIGRMPDPVNGEGPFMDAKDIALLSNWIDRNCPDDDKKLRQMP